MIVRESRMREHTCDLPPPSAHRKGTVAECSRCGRRWKLVRVGFSFKNWRRTLWTTLGDFARRERGVNRWASV